MLFRSQPGLKRPGLVRRDRFRPACGAVGPCGGLAGALNAEIAAVNAMAGKLSVDIEQRIALLKALASEIDSPLPAVARSAPVAQLIEAFEMNVLAGHDLAARKARADSVFTRRLEPHLLPAPADANDVSDEAQPQD